MSKGRQILTVLHPQKNRPQFRKNQRGTPNSTTDDEIESDQSSRKVKKIMKSKKK